MKSDRELIRDVIQRDDRQAFSQLVLRYERLVWTVAWQVLGDYLAPRFIEVTDQSDQQDVVLDQGVTLNGRVLDQSGNRVAGAVVGFRNTEHREMFAYIAVIGSAVKTDSQGKFRLPPLHGSYQLTVVKSAPDYSRQMMLVGTEPPDIEPVTIDTATADPDEMVVLKAK